MLRIWAYADDFNIKMGGSPSAFEPRTKDNSRGGVVWLQINEEDRERIISPENLETIGYLHVRKIVQKMMSFFFVVEIFARNKDRSSN